MAAGKGVEILGASGDRFGEILTPDALSLIASLQRALGPDADQDNALEAQRPVLDLGDVGELGGQARHTAQGVAVREIKVTGLVPRVGTGADGAHADLAEELLVNLG